MKFYIPSSDCTIEYALTVEKKPPPCLKGYPRNIYLHDVEKADNASLIETDFNDIEATVVLSVPKR